MQVASVNCNECGASDWAELVTYDYPERRSERDRTVKTAYRCQECGAEGRHFERKNSGTEQLTGAMREQ